MRQHLRRADCQKFKGLTTPAVGENGKQQKCSYPAGEGVTWYNHFGEQILNVINVLKMN